MTGDVAARRPVEGGVGAVGGGASAPLQLRGRGIDVAGGSDRRRDRVAVAALSLLVPGGRAEVRSMGADGAQRGGGAAGGVRGRRWVSGAPVTRRAARRDVQDAVDVAPGLPDAEARLCVRVTRRAVCCAGLRVWGRRWNAVAVAAVGLGRAGADPRRLRETPTAQGSAVAVHEAGTPVVRGRGAIHRGQRTPRQLGRRRVDVSWVVLVARDEVAVSAGAVTVPRRRHGVRLMRADAREAGVGAALGVTRRRGVREAAVAGRAASEATVGRGAPVTRVAGIGPRGRTAITPRAPVRGSAAVAPVTGLAHRSGVARAVTCGRAKRDPANEGPQRRRPLAASGKGGHH